MKNKTNSILGAIVVLLLLYTFFYEVKKPQVEKQKQEKESQLVSLLPEQIERVTLDRKKEKIVLVRKETGWFFLEPFEDEADSNVVDDYIQSLHRERFFEKVEAPEETTLDPKTFGFDEPLAQIEFEDSSKSKNLFVISSKKNFEGNAFLKIGDDPRVYVVNTLWQSLALRETNDFRDRRLLRSSMSSIDRVRFKNKKGYFELTKNENNWILVSDPDAKLNQNKVREFLTSLNDSKYSRWLLKNELSASNLKTYGLNQPEIELFLSSKELQSKILIGQSLEKKFYVFLSDLQTLAEVPQYVVEKFSNLSSSDMRDKKLAFDFDSTQVHRFKYTGSLKMLEKERSNPEFSSFLKLIKESEVAEFGNKIKLGSVKHNFSFLSETNTEVYKLEIGELVKKGSTSFYAARSTLEKETFLLSEAFLTALQNHSFFNDVGAKNQNKKDANDPQTESPQEISP